MKKWGQVLKNQSHEMIFEILDELADERLIQKISKARKEYENGGWIPFEQLKNDLSLV